MLYRCLRCGSTLVRPNKKETHLSDTIRKIWIPLDKWGSHSKVAQSLHINIFQRCSIVAMVAHKATFDAGEVERLVILVVVILDAEVFIPVVGHILLEESYKVFEKFKAVLSQFIAELATGDDDAPVEVVAHALAVLPEADINIQTSPVNTNADAICIPHNTARISVTISLVEVEIYFPMQKNYFPTQKVKCIL